jgi:uncharacterized protein (DUF2141 family)
MIKGSHTLMMAGVAALALAAAAPAAAADLRVEISGVEEAKGKMMIALFDSEANFDADDDEEASIAAQAVDAKMPVTETVFTGLEPGPYALKIFHDVDGDGEIDTNFFGIPSEPWAFSNNASGTMGPPGWDDAAFDLTADGVTQSIELN